MLITGVTSQDGVMIKTDAGSTIHLTRKEIKEAAEKFAILDNLQSFKAFPVKSVDGSKGECLVEVYIKAKETK
jgi:hypothetical protein